jgi:hypothetical protein
MGTSPVPTNAAVPLGLATNATPFLRTIICDSSMLTVAHSGMVSSSGTSAQSRSSAQSCSRRSSMAIPSSSCLVLGAASHGLKKVASSET